jgi:hypothetical protein
MFAPSGLPNQKVVNHPMIQWPDDPIRLLRRHSSHPLVLRRSQRVGDIAKCG